MLTARPIPAHEMLAVGGVQHCANSQEEALQYADSLVQRISGNAPGAIASCKRLVLAAAEEAPKLQYATAEDVFLDMMRPNEEAKYGIEMFRQKAKPDWKSIKA